MNEEDLKLVLAKYQQKAFDLFNRNIVLESQVETHTATVNTLSVELEKMKKSKRGSKVEEDFS